MRVENQILSVQVLYTYVREWSVLRADHPSTGDFGQPLRSILCSHTNSISDNQCQAARSRASKSRSNSQSKVLTSSLFFFPLAAPWGASSLPLFSSRWRSQFHVTGGVKERQNSDAHPVKKEEGRSLAWPRGGSTRENVESGAHGSRGRRFLVPGSSLRCIRRVNNKFTRVPLLRIAFNDLL